jgi:galactoside O-acetyltransferase
MMNTSYLSPEELADLGLKSYGKNVFVSRNAVFYDAGRISIGDNVRIDDFCIIIGDVTIGSNIHIAPYCALYGKYGIKLSDYCGLSARVTIYSAVDDFSGEYAVGPMVDESIRRMETGPVVLERYVQVCAGSVVLPHLTIGEGAVVGSLSMVKGDLQAWQVYGGIPVRRLKERKMELVDRIESLRNG